MYPLRFESLFKRYIWGGHRLAEVLKKQIGEQSAAESWEIVDHQDNQSVVSFGDLAGKSLKQLIADHGLDLLGEVAFQQISSNDLPPHLKNRFPLLLKFLDANRNLSVQVHPDDAMGARLSPPDLGKTEAWYVMHADPGSKIFAGLKTGTTQAAFQDAIESNNTESLLHSFEPKKGDCVFIQAGTLHAIGSGLLIAEIQQASNTTFRVYDWGRVDDSGMPRPLHIAKAIEATDFDRGPVTPEVYRTSPPNQWQAILDCDKFAMNRVVFDKPVETGGDGRFRILAVTQGAMTVSGDPSGLPMNLGDTMLLPACLAPVTLNPVNGDVEVLEFLTPG